MPTHITCLVTLIFLFYPAITDAYAQQEDLNNDLQVGAVNSDQFWQEVKFWVEIGAAIAVIIGTVIGGIWAYTKYVLEKSLLPPVQFFAECKNLGCHGDKKLLEVVVHIKNLGSHTLVARNIRVDILYLDKSDEGQELKFYRDPFRKIACSRLSHRSLGLYEDFSCLGSCLIS